jgi:ZIP family zinc transporter
MHSWQTVLFAFSLTLFAGLSTGIGSALAFYTKQTNKKFLSGALGFSAGVMVYVSFIEIFPKANESLSLVLGAEQGMLVTTLAFFGGIAVIALIDKFVPSYENPHEIYDLSNVDNLSELEDYEVKKKKRIQDKNLLRMGVFSALAIAIHNFPEGMATFFAALENPTLGISIAIAIAIHNIPEGVAVSIPIFFATGDKKKAFKYSFVSGLSEPIGAIAGYFILINFASDLMFGIIFAGVAGIMVYISLDELLPTAEKYSEHHVVIYGLIAGMALMATSLVMLG